MSTWALRHQPVRPFYPQFISAGCELYVEQTAPPSPTFPPAQKNQQMTDSWKSRVLCWDRPEGMQMGIRKCCICTWEGKHGLWISSGSLRWLWARIPQLVFGEQAWSPYNEASEVPQGNAFFQAEHAEGTQSCFPPKSWYWLHIYKAMI